MSEHDPNEGFASRWARRKRAAQGEEAERSVEAVEPANALDDPETLARRESNLAEAEAVDLEAIDARTDMSIFGRDGVPDWLRRKAYRALWRSNPVFANLDGLNDYDEDYTRPDRIMTTFKSAYEAGRGYLAHHEAVARRERAKEENAQEQEPTPLASVSTEPTPTVEPEVETSDPAKTVAPSAVVAHDTFVGSDEDRSYADTDEADAEAPQPHVSLRSRLMLDG